MFISFTLTYLIASKVRYEFQQAKLALTNILHSIFTIFLTYKNFKNGAKESLKVVRHIKQQMFLGKFIYVRLILLTVLINE
jgi:hypothetical protein